jgi:hypothetical protein
VIPANATVISETSHRLKNSHSHMRGAARTINVEPRMTADARPDARPDDPAALKRRLTVVTEDAPERNT